MSSNANTSLPVRHLTADNFLSGGRLLEISSRSWFVDPFSDLSRQEFQILRVLLVIENRTRTIAATSSALSTEQKRFDSDSTID